MKTETQPVPSLAELLRWIADMPAVFTDDSGATFNGKVWVRGVISDVYETLFQTRPAETHLQPFYVFTTTKLERNRLLWVRAACWVFWHPFFRQGAVDAERFWKLLTLDLTDLAAVIPVENLLTDQDRREELARLAMATTGSCFPGESWNEFKDRLTQVDSIESHRVISQAAIKEKKAREDRAKREKAVREEMARKAAEEAAAKESRE